MSQNLDPIQGSSCKLQKQVTAQRVCTPVVRGTPCSPTQLHTAPSGTISAHKAGRCRCFGTDAGTRGCSSGSPLDRSPVF